MVVHESYTLFNYMLLGHIQIAQVPARHEPDSAGEINYKYIFQLLRDCDYQGWIGLEYIPAGDTMTGLKWIQDLGESV